MNQPSGPPQRVRKRRKRVRRRSRVRREPAAARVGLARRESWRYIIGCHKLIKYENKFVN